MNSYMLLWKWGLVPIVIIISFGLTLCFGSEKPIYHSEKWTTFFIAVGLLWVYYWLNAVF